MKITDVTLTLFAWDDIPATHLRPPHRPLRRQEPARPAHPPHRRGRRGPRLPRLGERGAQLRRPSRSSASLKPIVLGQDPLDRERLFQRCWRAAAQTTLRAIGAVDVALWDLAGKVAKLPIHRLLGTYRDRVPAYASSAVLPSTQAYARGGGALQGARLDRLQDPPADRSGRPTSRSARPCGGRSATTTR